MELKGWRLASSSYGLTVRREDRELRSFEVGGKDEGRGMMDDRVAGMTDDRRRKRDGQRAKAEVRDRRTDVRNQDIVEHILLLSVHCLRFTIKTN